MNCKVSVIIPIYNSEKYLEKCIQSIRQQSLDDIEIICVNDASPDKCAEILNSFERCDPRIKVLTHPQNMSQAAARNTGMNSARGKYISFVDSDDWIEKDFLLKLYNAAEKNKVDIATGYAQMVCESNNTPIELWRDEMYGLPGIYKKKKIYDLLVKATYNGSIWNRIYKRSMLIEQGILFDPQIIGIEDLVFNVQAIVSAKRMVVTDASYFYLKRISSTMTRTDDEYIFSWLLSYEQIIASLNCSAVPRRIYLECIDNCQRGLGWQLNRISSDSSRAIFISKWNEIEAKLKYHQPKASVGA